MPISDTLLGPVYAFGELLWDRKHLSNGSIENFLGGAPANFAFRLRSLGTPCGLISAVGNDVLGRAAIDTLTLARLDLSLVERKEGSQTGTVDVKSNAGAGEHYTTNPITVAEAIFNRHPNLKTCLITLGKDGALGIERTVTGLHPVRADPIRVKVADTIGSGDPFSAGFIHMLRQGMPLGRCVEFGNILGALVATKPGGMCPIASIEIRNFEEQVRAERAAGPSGIASDRKTSRGISR